MIHATSVFLVAFSIATISNITSRTTASVPATMWTRKRSAVRTIRRSGTRLSAFARVGLSSHAPLDTTSTPTHAGVSQQNRGLSAKG